MSTQEVLGFIVALLFLVRVFCKRCERLVSWEWPLNVAIAACLLIGAGILLLSEEPEPTATRGDIGELSCSFEELRSALLQRDLETARGEAECIDANLILQTALDSGLVQLGLGNLETANAHFGYAIQFAPDDSSKASAFFFQGMTWALRGDILRAMNQPDSARLFYKISVTNFDSTLSYQSDLSEAWYNRGTALVYLELHKAAIASFDSMLILRPYDHDAWNNKGNSMQSLGRYVEAIASYDSSLKHKQDKHDAWYNRGNALGMTCPPYIDPV